MEHTNTHIMHRLSAGVSEMCAGIGCLLELLSRFDNLCVLMPNRPLLNVIPSSAQSF